jgi:hypothetical protein
MRKTLSTLSMLPGIAFATLPATGETVAICRGAPGYYRVETTKTADELNAMYGVSEAEAQALLATTRLDSDVPSAGDRGDLDGNDRQS